MHNSLNTSTAIWSFVAEALLVLSGSADLFDCQTNLQIDSVFSFGIIDPVGF